MIPGTPDHNKEQSLYKVRSWSKWAGHVERMEREWLTEDALRVEGRRRRPRLRCEDYMKRDLVRMGGERRTRARDGVVEKGGGQKNQKKSRNTIAASLTPDFKDKEVCNDNIQYSRILQYR